MLVSGPPLTAAAATMPRPAGAAPGLVPLLPAGDDGVEVVARFFRALADPARRRLLEFLAPGERTATECVAQGGLSQGRASVHRPASPPAAPRRPGRRAPEPYPGAATSRQPGP